MSGNVRYFRHILNFWLPPLRPGYAGPPPLRGEAWGSSTVWGGGNAARPTNGSKLILLPQEECDSQGQDAAGDHHGAGLGGQAGDENAQQAHEGQRSGGELQALGEILHAQGSEEGGDHIVEGGLEHRALEHRLQGNQQHNARHDDQCGGDGGGGHGDGADDLMLGGAGLGFCDGRGIHGAGDAHVGHIARQEAQIAAAHAQHGGVDEKFDDAGGVIDDAHLDDAVDEARPVGAQAVDGTEDHGHRQQRADHQHHADDHQAAAEDVQGLFHFLLSFF